MVLVTDYSKDAQLREQVRTLLEQDQTLFRYSIKADVVEGEVQLQGVVDTLSEKEQVARLVRQVRGVRRVDNAVAISTDGAISGKDVNMEVAQELAMDPKVDKTHITAESTGGHGTVLLKGHTDDPAEVKAAIRAASRARGVTRVLSQVKINDDEGMPSLEELFHSQVRNDREETEARTPHANN